MPSKDKWADRPMFALDADVTVYWPEVRPVYEEKQTIESIKENNAERRATLAHDVQSAGRIE